MSEGSPRRRGRRPAGEDTRAAIITAARGVFARKGYQAATLRGIAREAGVDPRLVHHYFEGKEGVFVEAMQLPARPTQIIGPVLEAPLHRIGEQLVRAFFGAWEAPEQRERIVALIGSAAGSTQGARLLGEFVSREILGRVVGQVPLPDAALRAELAAAQMIGVAFVRYVVRIEPLASAPVEQLVALLAPTVQRYLTGDHPPGDTGTVDPDPAGFVPAGPVPDGAAPEQVRGPAAGPEQD